MGDPRDHGFPWVKHGIFFYSNGGRFACDQWKAPSIDEQIVHVRRSVQIESEKPGSALSQI
jgi:hypothetical protein